MNVLDYTSESQAATVRSVDDKQLSKDGESKNELSQSGTQGSEKCETEEHSLDKIPSAQSLKESFILLCCNDSLRIYPVKSVVQGESKSIYEVKLSKHCCWTTIFKKDDKVCGLVVFYQTGAFEIRWNFKANMERMISSTENGHIVLANGAEVAFISLLVGENDFRIPESLPNLHDEVLAAAANAAISVSSDPKRKQGGNLGILGGIVKGFRGQRFDKPTYHDSNSNSNFDRLEGIFMKDPFPESSTTTDEQGAAELTIDDIVIDEPVPLVSTSSHEVNNRDKGAEYSVLIYLEFVTWTSLRVSGDIPFNLQMRKVNEKNCLMMVLTLSRDLEHGKKSSPHTEKLGMPPPLLDKQETSFSSAKKSLSESVDELKTYGMELKTLHL
ncbi:UNVERIFIED_CONTAM: hypothetical protein Slati_1657600 [Sesamum latifolium]|uniref:Uncharacterized protein n=1 Tax=Sesamum latifolium TaxID=2727402 RepID=A0AAW2XAK7_9LAMI